MDVHIPTGYVNVSKYEWFLNGISVKTTTDGSDPIYISDPLATATNNVYCKVTYQATDGSTTSPSSSTTFTPIIKVLDFPVNITAETPLPNYGCSSGTVSFSLPETPCTSTGFICDGTYNVSGNYNVTWQAPSGWVQTSLTNNGSNVSFTPDANSTGSLIATIHLPGCSYTETRSFAITRVAESPTFTKSAFGSCNGASSDISINPICGAINYTYSIVGNSGVTFTSNNLQTLTTSNTTVSVSSSGGTSSNSLKSIANYPNSISSTETSVPLTVGTPQPGPITFYLIDPTLGKIQAGIEPVPNATSYNWYKNSVLQAGHGSFIQFPITRNRCDVEYDIAVEAINSCGTSAQTHANAYMPPCNNSFTVTPNPASNSINVALDASNSQLSTNRTIDEIRIYDFQGTLKKYQSFNKVKTATINISALNTGTYIIEIVNGNYTEKHQLVIQK